MSKRAIKRDSWQGQVAGEMWVQAQASEKEICAACGISPTTLRRWRDWFDWDEARKQSARGYHGIYAAVQSQINNLAKSLNKVEPENLEGITDRRKELNQLLETAERVRKLQKDIDYKRLALRYTRELMDFLKRVNPEAHALMTEHLKAFTMEISRG